MMKVKASKELHITELDVLLTWQFKDGRKGKEPLDRHLI